MMKAVVYAALFLLVLCHGEALKCNFCYSEGTDLCATTDTQTCSVMANACGAVILTQPLQYSFRQCMNMAVCQGFITTPGAFASCCSTDLCNWVPQPDFLCHLETRQILLCSFIQLTTYNIFECFTFLLFCFYFFWLFPRVSKCDWTNLIVME